MDTPCGHTASTFDHAPLTCELPLGHSGWHQESVKLRDRVERTNWGDDGKSIHASTDDARRRS